MAEIKFDANKLVPIVVVIIAVVLGLNLNGKVSGLESRVVELNSAVEQLADVRGEIEEVTAQLSVIRDDVADVAQARDEILTAVCQVLERPVSQCGVAP